MTHNIEKTIISIGVILIIAGIIIWVWGGKFNWFGNLPGDIKIRRENFIFFFPVATMILLSIAVSAILLFIRKFMQ